MTAARVRTARVPDGPAFRLMLILLVVACSGQPVPAQTAAPGRQPVIRHAAGGQLSLFVASASLVCLACLGALAARAGGAPLRTGALRVAIWGAFAMAVTAGVGWICGVVV